MMINISNRSSTAKGEMSWPITRCDSKYCSFTLILEFAQGSIGMISYLGQSNVSLVILNQTKLVEEFPFGRVAFALTMYYP